MTDSTTGGDRPLAKPSVQIENDRVIVTEWRFPPGSHTGWHRHNHDYVVVPITTGELHIFDGKATVPAPLKHWMLLAIGSMYNTRNADGERAQVRHDFADALLAPYRIMGV